MTIPPQIKRISSRALVLKRAPLYQDLRSWPQTTHTESRVDGIKAWKVAPNIPPCLLMDSGPVSLSSMTMGQPQQETTPFSKLIPSTVMYRILIKSLMRKINEEIQFSIMLPLQRLPLKEIVTKIRRLTRGKCLWSERTRTKKPEQGLIHGRKEFQRKSHRRSVTIQLYISRLTIAIVALIPTCTLNSTTTRIIKGPSTIQIVDLPIPEASTGRYKITDTEGTTKPPLLILIITGSTVNMITPPRPMTLGRKAQI